MEKIIANEKTDKEFISRIYKQLMQLNTRKMNNPIKKWAQQMLKGLIQSTNTTEEKRSTKSTPIN